MSNTLVTVATFGSPVEANLARNELATAGVRAFLDSAETVGMTWQLGLALGGIKLLVAEQDAARARDILERVPDLIDSAEDLESAAEEKEPSWPEAPDEPEEPEPVLNDREQNAKRALRGAIIGLVFWPLQLYVFWLLIKVFVAEQPLAPVPRRHALWAVLINFLAMGLAYAVLRQ